MKQRDLQRTATPLLCSAIVARTFYSLMVDCRSPHAGAWISMLLGAALALPGLWGICQLRKAHPGNSALWFEAPLFLASAIDMASTMRGVSRSVAFLAPSPLSATSILLPLALVLFWCLSRGGDAIAYAAQLWIRVLPAILLLIAMVQLPLFRPSWLWPVEGRGWREITDGAVRVAGEILVCSGLLWVGQSPPDRVLRPLAVSAGCGVALIALRLMMTPPFASPHGEMWLLNLNSLLTNGRGPLYLQLPMITVWLIGLMQLLLCDGLIVAGLLRRALPKLNGYACAALTVLVGTAAYCAREANAALLAAPEAWQYIALSTGLSLSLLTRKGGIPSCAG